MKPLWTAKGKMQKVKKGDFPLLFPFCSRMGGKPVRVLSPRLLFCFAAYQHPLLKTGGELYDILCLVLSVDSF